MFSIIQTAGGSALYKCDNSRRVASCQILNIFESRANRICRWIEYGGVREREETKMTARFEAGATRKVNSH